MFLFNWLFRNCAFGVDIDIQNNTENEYFTNCEKTFSNSFKFTLPMYFGLYFFEFKNIMIDLAIVFFEIFGKFLKNVPPTFWLRQKISELVENRTRENVNFQS